MGIHCEVRKCTGCGVCAVACMDEKDIQPPLLRKIVLLIPLALLLPWLMNSVMGIYIAEPIADITASFTSMALFLSKRKTLLPDGGAPAKSK